MAIAQGTVKWVGSKVIRNSKLWSFSLNESDEFFRTGFDQPNVNRGDFVEFEYEVNQYGNQVKAKDLKVKVQTAATTSPPARVGSAGVPAAGKDEYWKQKEENDKSKDAAIQLMSCTNTAVSILKLAQEAGVLTLGSGAKANKLDTLLAQVYMIRDELYLHTETARANVKAGKAVVEDPQSQDAELDDYIEEGV